MRSFLFNLFFYGFTAILTPVVWLVAKFGSRGALWALIKFWGKTVIGGIRLILNSRIEMRGLEHLPEGGSWLLVCKHQSELDAVLLASILPHSGAVAMQELEQYPLFGPILHKLGLVLVPTEGPRANRTAQVVDGAKRILAEGRPMVIFPEGTLMSLGAHERYRKGVGHMYQAMGTPAVLVASSLGVIWPRREWTKYPNATAAIEVLEPVQPGMELEEFMAEAETRIEAATMALIREHAKGEVLAAAEDRYARGVANED
ncbi:MAG TPA: 1-acyl-sn-glycerol-3-phosphate acyltransferase [Thermohalobaculum sp.]|nr:1-acyl-sn-glycerol-3-phosphate acyltransferase [Thermohalobaculum sp.]